MQIEALRRFVVLARAGSFYQAAKQSDISVQGYSKLLSSLEKELGVKLAVRGKKGIRLTLAGELLLDYAERTVTETNWLIERLHEEANGQLGKPRRSKMYSTHYGMLLISCLDYLYESLSDFDLREEPFDRLIARAQNPDDDDTFCVDVLFETTLAELGRRGLAYIPFYASIVGVAVRQDCPFTHASQVPKTDVASLNLAHYPHREWSAKVTEVFTASIADSIRYESSGLTLLLDYARGGNNRGFLIDSFMFYAMQKHPVLNTEKLRFVALEDKSAFFTGGMIYSRSHPLSAKARTTIDRYHRFSQTEVNDYLSSYPQLSVSALP